MEIINSDESVFRIRLEGFPGNRTAGPCNYWMNPSSPHRCPRVRRVRHHLDFISLDLVVS